jgi:asparagine synthase (glutamine-hydrolysing)
VCGIAGIATVSGGDHGEVVRAMTSRIVHRGPDSDGHHVEPNVALGIRRLRIIDLVTGEQPQSNEDGTVWTVFNGEIYNFRELRAELEARGHRLVTRSDTETIVHLYEDHAERFVERLEGMFALAVWDSRTRTLVLARDRMGKKPLVYRETAEGIAFASEHAALLEAMGERPSVDPAAIGLYLRLGYVPAPFDSFRGVRKLPPAHVLVWRGGRSELRRYWSTPQPGSLRITDEEAVERIRELLERAVVRRLVADVPLGAFLSGGVDSSAVVAMMARNSSRVRTFTIGFEDAEYSEVAHARRVAERYGTEHHEWIVRPGELDILPTLVRHYGEPFADSSAVPTYYLSRMTREHVTVALNGDGGDELFAGYDRYFAVQLAAGLDRMPAPVRSALRGVASWLPDSTSPTDPVRRARRFLLATALPARERYLQWLGVFGRGEFDGLIAPGFAEAAATGPSVDVVRPFAMNGHDPVAAAQLLDLTLYLPDDLLVKVDIASMANSLEVRCPMLDRELVEFAVSLPSEQKMRGGQRKYLLKRALRGIVPDENMDRRKQGFAIPVGKWFRGDLARYAEDVILSDRARARGYFRPERLERLVREHTTGAVDRTHQVWSLLMLELWHRAFVDASDLAAVA